MTNILLIIATLCHVSSQCYRHYETCVESRPETQAYHEAVDCKEEAKHNTAGNGVLCLMGEPVVPMKALDWCLDHKPYVKSEHCWTSKGEKGRNGGGDGGDAILCDGAFMIQAGGGGRYGAIPLEKRVDK
jgi:hypothetical protein